MSKIKTQSAQAAAAIKAELKLIGIKARVKSSNFSMGNSVSVTVTDQPPSKLKEIEQLCKKYQYGHFNGMEDIYEYSNSRDDIPQSKYVSVDHEMTESYIAELIEKINAYYGLTVTLEEYKRSPWNIEFNSRFGASDFGNELYRLSRGSIDYDESDRHEKREREILAELQKNHGFQNSSREGSNVWVYLREACESNGCYWIISAGYGRCETIEESYTRPAADMAAEIAKIFTNLDEQDKAEAARINAEHERNNREFVPVSITEPDRLDVAYFPSLNKNNDTDENDAAIKEKSYKNNVLIKKSITLTDEDYLIFSESLLTNRPYLLSGVGEHFIDDKFLEGLTEQSPEYYAAWREHGITTVVEVVNVNKNEVLIINTEGYSYARYTGRTAEWHAYQTTRNILASFTSANLH